MTVEYYWLDDHGHFHRIAVEASVALEGVSP